LRDRVVGRVSQEDVYDPLTGEQIVSQNDEFTDDLANAVQEAGIEQVKIRSVLTCETRRGVCRRCYGRNLASGKLVEIGEAVGVIAAESIGEPGTQLTMRTFHVGGTASRVSEQSKHEATSPGRVQMINVSTVTNKNGDLVVINRNGKLLIMEDTAARKGKKGEKPEIAAGSREKERYALVYGSTLKVHDGQHVEAGQALVEWDPFTSAVLTEVGGKVVFKDIIEGENVREETDKVTGLTQMVIVESAAAEKRTPTITIKAKSGDDKKYLLPTGAHVMVQNGQEVYPGDILAKIPRATTKTKDITGGLPRVVELFEARHPRDKAVITEVDGTVHHGAIVKGMRRIIVETDEGTRHEYSVPRSVHVNVQEGERVRAGDPLIDGPIDPHDVLAVLGIKELQRYLVDKIQEVYRSQSVQINDKHIETICRQMLRSVRVTRVGDTDFLVDEQADRFRFMEENEKVMNRGGEPADGVPLLLGITKASLSTESFISAASFQETTRVLTEAAIAGRVDYLRGLKENVIVGRLIPAGTGMPVYREVYLEKDEAPAQPSLEELLRPEDEEALSLADFDDEQ
ncbi:MAG TPA: DNA-directed RNA polymerase subunit beta', partial [Thermoanaerobaculia bacterium]|nr:DNA-directed RNA polymerase subunit beta' [Thermoanaerobaculia bacterium]